MKKVFAFLLVAGCVSAFGMSEKKHHEGHEGKQMEQKSEPSREVSSESKEWQEDGKEFQETHMFEQKVWGSEH